MSRAQCIADVMAIFDVRLPSGEAVFKKRRFGPTLTIAGLRREVQRVFPGKQFKLVSSGGTLLIGESAVDPNSIHDSCHVTVVFVRLRQIYSTGLAFAAVKANGSVVTWGSAGAGGDSQAVREQLAEVQHSYSTLLSLIHISEPTRPY